jgi:PIN domain nuclease of toxin-antitoxin system
VILFDAYAVIAYLQADPHAGPAVRGILATPGNAAITSVNAAEVIDHLVRIRRAEPDEAVLDLAQLHLDIVEVDADTAIHAGLLRARHYHRRDRQVSLADCIAASALLQADNADDLVTADPHLLDLVHSEGGRVIALPESDGSVWRPPAH